jgi:predicted glutamine amidotransferase
MPTAVTVSMRALARHGSQARHLGDGWGIAFHADDDALLIKQPGAANDCPWVGFPETRRIRSRAVIAHIRRATQGERACRMHVFAHNGKLPGIEQCFASAFHRFRPIGSTDSEVAFCVLQKRLAPLWERGALSPAMRVDIVATLARELREHGPAKFLYSARGQPLRESRIAGTLPIRPTSCSPEGSGGGGNDKMDSEQTNTR